jgi:diguanylate cyclase (GGDEF)-like protein/PAS domain S-box-containing protein
VDAIVESGSFSMVAVDDEGVVTYWNRAAERLYGWRAAEAIGRPIEIVLSEDQRDEFAVMLAALRRGERIAATDTVRCARDGRDIHVHVQLSPIIDGIGRFVGASSLEVENSEQVRTQEALARSEARYHTLVDALTQFVLVTNADGRVDRALPSWSAYTGQEAEECAGRGWLDALHPHDRPQFDRQWFEGRESAEPFSISARLLHGATGEFRHVAGRVAPMCRHDGRVVEWVAALSDVHELYLSQERERQTADRFRRIFAANVFGICYGEHDRILDANKAMLEMLGYPRRALAGGIPIRDLMVRHESARPDGSDGDAREFEVRRADGTTAFLLAAAVSLSPERGWLAVAVDVTQRKASEQEAQYGALHDSLTGLPNRRLLVDRLQRAVARAARTGNLVGVLFCDLDHFKSINDQFGHAAGDAVLTQVARRVQRPLRDTDTVARTGGDEFVVLLDDLTDTADAARIAERIRNMFAEPVDFEGQLLHVTTSIGIALSVDRDDRIEALLARADDALYRAKEDGRDQVAIAGTVAAPRSARRRLEGALQRDLAQDTLDLAFQPVIDLRDGTPVGAEVLLRWRLEGQLIPAATAISIAEESGIIIRVTDWVVQRACLTFGEWRTVHAVARDWRLHINVSARDLADGRFVDRMLTEIAAGGCAPTDVCLEVTETAMVSQPGQGYTRLCQLREQGVSVAIDHFGAGYSSLGVLRDLPADMMKLDRSFVAGLDRSERDRSIVAHAIDLAHTLGLTVVGEGVETLAQISLLIDLACDLAQGYAFAHPQPLSELTVTA